MWWCVRCCWGVLVHKYATCVASWHTPTKIGIVVWKMTNTLGQRLYVALLFNLVSALLFMDWQPSELDNKVNATRGTHMSGTLRKYGDTVVTAFSQWFGINCDIWHSWMKGGARAAFAHLAAWQLYCSSQRYPFRKLLYMLCCEYWRYWLATPNRPICKYNRAKHFPCCQNWHRKK